MRTSTAVLGVLALAHFAVSVDFNIVYIALPEIGAALGFSERSLAWVVNSFALTYGGFLLLGGRATDRLGARRMLIAGGAILGLASIVGATAGHASTLIAARAAQGIGAALLFPATLALIGALFPDGPERTRAMAVWGTAGAFGALAGGAVGGLLTSALGWASVFWVLVPITLAVVGGALRLLPSDDRRPTVSGFDLPGAATFTTGALLVVFGIFEAGARGWWTPRGGGIVAIGLASLAALVPIERRSADPLIPPRLLRNRPLAVSVALVFVLMGTISTLHYVYTTHVQGALGLTPFAAGLGFLPQGAAATVASMLLIPKMLGSWGYRRSLMAGTIGVGVTSLLFALAVGGGTYWAILPVVTLLGVTAGTTYPALFANAGSEVQPTEQGVSASIVSTSQQIGAAVGLAGLLAVADTGGAGSEPNLITAAWVGGVATIAAAGFTLLLRRPATILQDEVPVANRQDPAVGVGSSRDA